MCVHVGPEIDPDRRDVVPDDNEDERTLAIMINKHFPGLEDKPSIKDTCLYTVSFYLILDVLLVINFQYHC